MLDLFGDAPLQLLHGEALANFGLRADEVHDGFSLGEVESAIEKRTHGEFTWIGHARSLSQDEAEDALQDEGAAVPMYLYDILTCVGMRGLHEGDQRFVEYFLCPWHDDMPVGEQVRRREVGVASGAPHER